jgi:hypothetical protein
MTWLAISITDGGFVVGKHPEALDPPGGVAHLDREASTLDVTEAA